MRMRNTFCTAALLAAALGAVADAQTPPPQTTAPPSQFLPQQEPEPANVVATVNDDVITQEEFEVSLQPHLEANPQIDQQKSQILRDQVLNSMVDGLLVQQHMLEQGPDVAEEEVKATIDKVKNQVQAEGAEYEQFLEERGLTEKTMEKRITGMLAWQKYQQQVVTEPKLQEFYTQNQQHFGEQDYAQVRQRVAQSYVAGVWKAIADKVRPEAKIKIVRPGGDQPAGPTNGPVVPDSPPRQQ